MKLSLQKVPSITTPLGQTMSNFGTGAPNLLSSYHESAVSSSDRRRVVELLTTNDNRDYSNHDTLNSFLLPNQVTSGRQETDMEVSGTNRTTNRRTETDLMNSCTRRETNDLYNKLRRKNTHMIINNRI
jgi:hypothetical protein